MIERRYKKLKLRKIENKKGQGVVTGIFSAVVGLVVLLIIGFVVVSQLNGAGLLTANSAEQNATDFIIGNLSSGVNNVSAKIPTIFTIGIVVVLIGLLVFLWSRSRPIMTGGGGSSL